VKDYPSVAEYAEELLRRWFALVIIRTLGNIILRNRSVSLEDMAVKGDSKRLSLKIIKRIVGKGEFRLYCNVITHAYQEPLY
jgi:hypothetical protein